MNKIGIIIAREYKTRVMKKSFIILTFLTPILMSALMFLPALIGFWGESSHRTIDVIDKTGLYADVLQSNEIYTFNFVENNIENERKKISENENLTGLLVIADTLSKNPNAATLFSENQIDIDTKDYISDLLNADVRKQKLALYNIPDLDEIDADLNKNISIATIKWVENGQEKLGSSELALIIGMVAAILIYMFIMLYGSQVMTGVVQEKTNRIVEVIISSVKPFELMMGKIIGVALVGLTQIFMWVFLAGILMMIGMQFLPHETLDTQSIMSMQSGMSAENLSFTQEIISSLSGFNFLQIILLLIVYFIGGYLLYASIFAAVGSAVDNETDSNQFTLPITLPILFAFYAGFYASQHPDASFSFWTSLIPFTSPVVMMARLPFGVPVWQIIVSIVILILSFIGTTWLAGKIYRTGILMYGKKVTWKEMWKWLRY
jgi:ABC-2 type transport system permease protein